METIQVRSNRKVRITMLPLIIVLVIVVGVIAGFATVQNNSSDTILEDHLSVPLEGITAAKVEIFAGDGNLRIDPLTGAEPVLASGILQYGKKQGTPTQAIDANNGQATVTLRANKSAQRWSALPWAACNGATEWKVFLTPTIPLDITAHSEGGNVTLNLTGISATRILADTGGGNIELTLPANAANLSATAKTGAGNVVVHIPNGVAARIHATTGLGKAIVDARFSQIDKTTYQSPDYDSAANKVELTLQSGAGNVSINQK